MTKDREKILEEQARKDRAEDERAAAADPDRRRPPFEPENPVEKARSATEEGVLG